MSGRVSSFVSFYNAKTSYTELTLSADYDLTTAKNYNQSHRYRYSYHYRYH